jgi:CubicO group peptidase (beta-lactamase class C family)
MLHRRAVLVGALAASFSGVRAYAEAPSDAAIRAMLQERVGSDRQSTGIVAVVSDAEGSRSFAYGRTRHRGQPRPLDGDTVFEIGSITKVLTALILADMVARGEVAMNEPGTHYEYANLGFGLLGHALARRAEKSYEALRSTPSCPAIR